jgi:hypothetical protein
MQSLLDVRQRDVHHGHIEDDHELSTEHHQQGDARTVVVSAPQRASLRWRDGS